MSMIYSQSLTRLRSAGGERGGWHRRLPRRPRASGADHAQRAEPGSRTADDERRAAHRRPPAHHPQPRAAAGPRGVRRGQLDARPARHPGAARSTRTVQAAPFAAMWITGRRATDSAGVLLYLHGGGFVFGSRKTHRHFVAALSVTTGRPAFLVDYRRAPEHPFPAAADDALAAYRWLLATGYRPGADRGRRRLGRRAPHRGPARGPVPAPAADAGRGRAVLPVPRPDRRRARRPGRGAA